MNGAVCNLCRFPGCEIRILGCGCCIHARCAPMSLVLDLQGAPLQNFGTFPAPNKTKSSVCPVCFSGNVDGIYVEPLDFTDVERAIELRRRGVASEPAQIYNDGQTQPNTSRKHPRNEETEIATESSYLLLSNARSSLPSSGLTREQQRTGRWTNEEIAFVDYLVNAFDQGLLPLPHGIKLNEFLGDLLLCKSSRLTKKMKNAKLSTRSYVLCSPQSQSASIDCERLSSLQETFLSSVTSEPTKLELRFNFSKQWRTHFSNLCVQVGYTCLDGKDWIASLEDMELRATQAEDAIKRVRRRKLSIALQTDGGSSANPSVFIGGVKAENAASQLQSDFQLGMEQTTTANDKVRTISASDEPVYREVDDDDPFALLNSNGNSFVAKRGRSRTLSVDFLENPRHRSFSEDFDAVLDTLMEEEAHASAAAAAPMPQETSPETRSKTTGSPHSCGAFLDAIVHYMETRNLPFQHADLWVPSFSPRESTGPSKAVDTEHLRLHHAGHATRGDLDDGLAYMLHEFGIYSDNFSFEPGHGLPGRVYSSGTSLWECGVEDKDPNVFERAGGAKVYGVKTAVGIPLNTALVGRIVVAMYSCESIPEDMQLARDCAAELSKYSLEPQWKLFIDVKAPPPDIGNVDDQPLQLMSGSLEKSALYNMESLPSVSSAEPSRWNDNTSPPAAAGSQVNREEQDLITLLGQHMPSLDTLDPGQQGSSSDDFHSLLPHFMSVRLLLLRSPERRTLEENEMIDVLKSSYRAYAKDSRRGSKELAGLLVKDWVCLKSTYSLQNTSLIRPTTAVPQKPLQPVPRRLSSEAPHPRLGGEPIRRTSSASLHSQSHPASPSSSTQSLHISNGSAPQSLDHSFQTFSRVSPRPVKAPFQPLSLSSRTPEPMQQLNHAHYLPVTSSADDPYQPPNGMGNRPTSNSIDSTGSLKPLPTMSSFNPQAMQPSPQHRNALNVIPAPNVVLER